MAHDPRWIALLLRLYPRAYRERHGDDLAAAMRACVERERQAGAPVFVTAARLVGDTIAASFLLRSVRPTRSGDPIMRSIAGDFRYALRLLRRAPLFSALAIATLALAIGANTAIFSIVNGVLLRDLPYREPGRLVLMYEAIISPQEPFGFSAPDFVALRERARSFETLAVYRNAEYELSGVDMPERIVGARASAGLFDVLGVRPALGRAFTADEDTSRQPVAILTDRLWRRTFGGDPAIIGKAVILDRRPFTIVGVLPASLTFPNRGPHLNNLPAEVFVPMSFTNSELRAFGAMYNNTVVARLKPGVTVEQATAEIVPLGKQVLAEIYPAELRELSQIVTVVVRPLRDNIVGGVSRILYVLLAAVGVVLLIACADIACLTLTRAAAREREMAIRTALGAGRGRVMRLIFIETATIAAAGGLAGLALAWWGQRVILAAAPAGIPRAEEITFDARVLLFTLGAAIAAALFCGLLPALESARRDSGTTLKEGGRGSASTRQRRIFNALVTAQFACAVVLVSSGGLLIRSFIRLVSIDPGFRAENAVSAATNLPAVTYRTGADVRAFYAQLVERVRRLPGVTAAGAATDLPLTVRERRAFTVENPSPAVAQLPGAVANDWVMGDYFTAIGSRILNGRPLGDADGPSSEPVILVNETLAKRYWPGLDPVGRRLAWGNQRNHGPWMRVVGVVADIKQAGLAAATEPQTWQPWTQLPDSLLGSTVVTSFRGLRLMVRAQVPPATLVAAIRAEVRALDPSLPMTNVMTLDEVIGASAGVQKFNAALLGGFAGVALLLAAIGIGGVLAISVSRRTQEIGIRLALGAPRGDVVRMVVRQGMLLVAAGLVIGLPCAIAAARLLRSLLFQTAPHDAVSFAAAIAILAAVALLACAAPAIRASRVSPVTALRVD